MREMRRKAAGTPGGTPFMSSQICHAWNGTKRVFLPYGTICILFYFILLFLLFVLLPRSGLKLTAGIES